MADLPADLVHISAPQSHTSKDSGHTDCMGPMEVVEAKVEHNRATDQVGRQDMTHTPQDTEEAERMADTENVVKAELEVVALNNPHEMAVAGLPYRAEPHSEDLQHAKESESGQTGLLETAQKGLGQHHDHEPLPPRRVEIECGTLGIRSA